jgi:hypothetical protein
MRRLFIGLAFCSCAYTALACYMQGMAGQETNGALPLFMVSFRLFAVSSFFCCLWGAFRIVPATIAIWIVTLIYLLTSWRLNAAWVFHEDLTRFTLWAPIFLTIAALVPKRTMARDLPSAPRD